MWQQAEDDEAIVSWARWHRSALEPHATGAYVNFLADQGADETRSAYSRATLDGLAALKRRSDPGNLLRSNHNIAPAG